MIDFKLLAMQDKIWIDQILKESDCRGCDYSFGNLFIWRKAANTMAALIQGALCIMSVSIYDNSIIYMYPAGEGDMKPVLEELMQDAADRGTVFRMRAVQKENVEKLEAWFPGMLQAEPMRDEFDYIYETAKMASLSGQKYHGKRNHIKRFMDAEEWHYEALDDTNLEDCIRMNEEWCRSNGCDRSVEYRAEQCAVGEAFKHYKELGFLGGVLYQNHKAAAFTIGEAFRKDTFIVHIEKANPEIQGAYPMINQQFVLHNMQEFYYVNREEDLGKEGLRKAKLSYYPEILLEKYTVWMK